MNYLFAENAFAERTMRSSGILQKNLFEEIKGYSREQYSSLPVKRDSFYYYNRMEKGSNYIIIARKKDSLSAPEEIVLDGNKQAKGQNYFSLQFIAISTNHRYIAFGNNQYGGDAGDLRIKDMLGDSLLPDEIPNVETVVWANDNRTLFYVSEDPVSKRATRIFRHRMGTPKEQDVLVYEETRPGYFPSIQGTSSKDFILIGGGNFVESNIWYLDANAPESAIKRFGADLPPSNYYLDQTKGGDWLVYTNQNAPDMRTAILDSINQPWKTWKDLVPEKDSCRLGSVLLLENYQVFERLENGNSQIHIRNRQSDSSWTIEFPESAYSVNMMNQNDYHASTIRYSYSSMVTPNQVHEYDLVTGRDTIIQNTPIKGYKPSRFKTERIWAPSRDGKKIAIDLVYKKGLKRDGTNPVMLNAYASYGNNSMPGFYISRLGYLERGFIIAIPHARGESFLGQAWHDDGKLLNKRNTFNDVIDATEFMIAEGYTQKGKIALQGGSAGGLLVGAVINDRPDLYQVAIANAPFVDVFNDMHNDKWPNIIAHYDEIGNPNIREFHDYLLSYCPYNNVKAQNYPNLLVTNGLNDSRVPFWAPAKWTAKLRALKTDSNLLLLKTNMESGHFGGSGRYTRWKEVAYEMAFVFEAMGIRENYLVVSGKVEDVHGEVLPYVNVYLKGTTYGTTTNFDGEFTLEVKEEALSDLVFQYVGYEKQFLALQLDEPLTGLQVTLLSEDIQLPQFTVSAKAKDPAYGIIKNAIARRKYYLNQVDAYSGDLYIKGATRLNEIPKKLPKFLFGDDVPDSTDLGLVYLSESVARFHTRKPMDYKEEMIASKVAGQGGAFSWNRASDVLFNFYENSLKFREVSERGFVSPIASTALLYYKYRLEGTFRDNGKVINKIKLIPRRNSDPIFHGHIYITEDTWNIHSLDVFLTKEAQIEFVDTISIAQSYTELQDSIWMPFSLKIGYHYKVFGFGAKYEAIGVFSNYKINRSFPEKFFRNEIFRIETGADNKDSIYWTDERPLILTEEEESNYAKGDSLTRLKQSPEYLDSIDAKFNKPSFGDVLINGYSHRKSIDSLYWGTNSLLGALQYNTIEGGVLEVKPWIFKRRQNGFSRYTANVRYGEARDRLNGKLGLYHQFNNFNFLSIKANAGHYIEQINQEEPIIPIINSVYSLLAERNYMKLYEKTFANFELRRELVNGLYSSAKVEYAQRQVLNNNSDFTLVDYDNREFTSNALENRPTGPNDALSVEVNLTYRHQQQYSSFPNRKSIHGSRFPTLYFKYKKGLQALGSDVNYDFLSFGIGDNLKMGLFGISKYDVIVGQFVNRESMAVFDYNHFLGNRIPITQSPAWEYSDQLRGQIRNFQTLDYYDFSTNRSFIEGHFEHHFNGFLLNKIPLVRKLKWQALAGVNVLYTEDKGDFSEVYVGVENIFRFLRVDFASSYESGGRLKPQLRLGIDFGF